MSKKSRILLFVFVCMVVRLAFVGLAVFLQQNHPSSLPYVGIAALIPVIYFLVEYIGDYQTTKGAFQGDVWWHSLRPVHACLYLLCFVYALKKDPSIWKPLLVDVGIGVTAFGLRYTDGASV